MEKEAAKQKFSIARSMYMAGQYEEALALLDELGKEHPAVFNIEFRMLQCFMQLGRLEDVKELYELMTAVYKKESHQEKLRSVQVWLREQAGDDDENKDEFDDLKVDLGVEALGVDLMGDLFENSVSHKKQVSSTSTRTVAAQPAFPWKIIAAGLVIVLAAAAGGIYVFMPGILGYAPQFSADIVLGLPFANLEGKFYRKSMEASRTELMGQVVIVKHDTIYRILPEEKKYCVAKLKDMANQAPLAEMNNFEKWIKDNNGKKTGQETLYGYLCDIYEAQVRMSPSVPPADTKFWYALDLKFPVKSETTKTTLMGKVVMFLRNIKPGAVPPALFELPKGMTKVSVEEISAITRREGLGGERPLGTRQPGMDTAPDNSRNLSPADLKKLKEQLNL